MLLKRGRARDAVAEFKRASELRPGMPETLLELGKATAATGDFASAEKLLRQVLERERASDVAESAHFQMAEVYRKLGRAADADRERRLFQEMRKSRQ